MSFKDQVLYTYQPWWGYDPTTAECNIWFNSGLLFIYSNKVAEQKWMYHPIITKTGQKQETYR